MSGDPARTSAVAEDTLAIMANGSLCKLEARLPEHRLSIEVHLTVKNNRRELCMVTKRHVDDDGFKEQKRWLNLNAEQSAAEVAASWLCDSLLDYPRVPPREWEEGVELPLRHTMFRLFAKLDIEELANADSPFLRHETAEA